MGRDKDGAGLILEQCGRHTEVQERVQRRELRRGAVRSRAMGFRFGEGVKRKQGKLCLAQQDVWRVQCEASQQKHTWRTRVSTRLDQLSQSRLERRDNLPVVVAVACRWLDNTIWTGALAAWSSQGYVMWQARQQDGGWLEGVTRSVVVIGLQGVCGNEVRSLRLLRRRDGRFWGVRRTHSVLMCTE